MRSRDVITGLDSNAMGRIHNLLAQLKGELSFLVSVDDAERLTLVPVDQRRAVFCEVSHHHVVHNKDLLKLDTDFVANVQRLYFDFSSLTDVKRDLDILTDGVDVTRMLIGSNLFRECLIARDMVNVAVRQGIPGSEVIRNEMGKSFSKMGRQTNHNGGGSTPAPDAPPTV